ncbi:transketolase [Lactonifactor longoviformis]|uniref:transketolase family protein n=1 Tax=Lactonifactor longoviformis TaxID=341220 RepID=UPI001D02CF94|nr:transketolase C-terminal domain-containing protein [Lactonifactor longoviformis]MCB5711289.1 transketolase [Lactonifactor longoviformis]MCB5715256.1 transketolase [Lactonifactor longoviformis]MCQ4669712.1 transketolase [Lactonifactor longoviformis]
MKQSYTLDEYNSARSVVGDTIAELGGKDNRVWLLTPDIGFGCKDFKEKYPDRFLDTGIAEQNVVGISSGLAYDGNIPFIIGMMPFMSMRALEQVRTDICYPNLPVRIIANYAGLTGNGGSTHYAMEDMALYSSLVNMTVCAASDPVQLRQIIEKSMTYDGPLSIRIDPGKENRILYPSDADFEIGKGFTAREGRDIAVIACGEMVDYALQLHDAAEKEGISVRVIDMFTVKPLDEEIVRKAASETGRIIVWEDHLMKNGLASAVADVLCDQGISVKSFKRFGVPQVYPGFGSPEELYHQYQYDLEAVLSYVKSLF